MQVAAFIFIHRKWKDDKSHFEDMIDYFCVIHEPLQLLIFPEGTDLTGKLAWVWVTEFINLETTSQISYRVCEYQQNGCTTPKVTQLMAPKPDLLIQS